MGNSSSYIKIKQSNHDLTCRFAFHIDDQYQKVIISTHPDNLFNRREGIDASDFENFGDKYDYDGNQYKLNQILTEFRPDRNGLDYLMRRLHDDVSLHEHRGIWGKIKDWVTATVKYIKENARHLPWMIRGAKWMLDWYRGQPQLPAGPVQLVGY